MVQMVQTLEPVITTAGDVLYRDGSGLQRLAKGTAGQALVMNSGATAPQWGRGGAVTANATGGTITDLGEWRYHAFTGSGTFTMVGSGYCESLCIGGGGGSGYDNAGGAGAGGFKFVRADVSSGTYTVTVGAGGTHTNNG